MASQALKRSFEDTLASNGTAIPSEPSSKKARPTVESSETLWTVVTSLPHDLTQRVLFQLCTENPAIADAVRTMRQKYLAKQAAAQAALPAINFDSYSRDCWHALNTQYRGLSGSKQYDVVDKVVRSLNHNRKEILRRARPSTRWETRRNALEVMRKICKSIVLCNEGVIRHELTSSPEEVAPFADSMTLLARSMSHEERDKYKQEGLYSKLVELQSIYAEHAISEVFNDLFDAFEREAGDTDIENDFDISSDEEDLEQYDEDDDDEEEDEYSE